MGDSFILRKRYNQSGVRSLELGVILLEKILENKISPNSRLLTPNSKLPYLCRFYGKKTNRSFSHTGL